MSQPPDPLTRPGSPPPEPPASEPLDAERPSQHDDERPAAEHRSPNSERGPEYKGEPLDAERGPGLGCFWFQVVLLAVLLVVTPLSVVAAMPPWVSATLLIASLAVLFFVGQTSIFLLRLVAADRRTRRVPRSAKARRTVGQLEDERADRPADESVGGPAGEGRPSGPADEGRPQPSEEDDARAG